MIVNIERDAFKDDVFAITWPDSQISFHLFCRTNKVDGVKEAVYILMDKYRTKFYIGESSEVMSRLQNHKSTKDFWDCVLVIEDTHGEFKKYDVIKWVEWRLHQIAIERNRGEQRYEIKSKAGKQEEKPWLEKRIDDILSVCRFLGIPWGYLPEEQSKPTPDVKDKEPKVKHDGYVDKKKHPAPSFTFAMAHIPERAELIFIEGGQKVVAKGKNQVEYGGETYSLTGFVKKFIPQSRRNKKDAYQGPAFFTYKGELLTVLRNKHENENPCVVAAETLKNLKEVCVSGLGKTQLAKKIAMLVDGREGAFGGILQYFSKFKPCPKTGKWRKPLADVGIKFDKDDFVIDWHVAKI